MKIGARFQQAIDKVKKIKTRNSGQNDIRKYFKGYEEPQGTVQVAGKKI